MNPNGINDEAEDPRAWIHGDESAKTMLARLLTERSLLLLPPLHRLPLRVGNVVEITGPSSSAKSQVLLQAAVHCILPKEWKGIRFGGLERIVIYFDLDCRFDVLRLTQILRFRILGVLGSINGSNQALQEGFQKYHGEASMMNSVYDELIVTCMKRFLYIRCYDSYEFLAALKTMHSRAQVESGVLGVGIHFLMIDSIGAFYWIDRSIQPSNSVDYKRGTMSFQHLVETIVQEIRKFLEVQPVLVLVSKTSIFGAGMSIDAQRDLEMCNSSRDTDKFLYREYMPSAWQALVTHRMNLQLSGWNLSDLNFPDFFSSRCSFFRIMHTSTGKAGILVANIIRTEHMHILFLVSTCMPGKASSISISGDISQPQAVLYSQLCLSPPKSFL